MVKKMVSAAVGVVLFAGAFLLFHPGSEFWKSGAREAADLSAEPSHPASATAPASAPASSPAPSASAAPELSIEQLIEKYKHLHWIDAHYHGASGIEVIPQQSDRERFAVERTALFGAVSDPPAVDDDDFSFQMYEEEKERYIPFFSGIDLHDPQGVNAAEKRFDQGFYGMGEIAAASSFSPVLANVAWKAKDAMDGILPDLYKLCAKMKAPILLHIDPLSGPQLEKLSEALDANPDTEFILGHANAFNSPDNVEAILKGHPNLTIDFFAGFTAFNPQSMFTLQDYAPLIRKYPDRFVVSTDSGFDIGYDKALEAGYRLFEAVGDEQTNRKIAHDNLEKIIRTREQAINARD